MKNKLLAATLLLVLLSLFSNTARAQLKDAVQTKEFRLEQKTKTLTSGRVVDYWFLCLNEYRVLISGQKRYIPVFPVYTEACFKTKRDRAVDTLERAVNALDSLSHGEQLMVMPPPKNGNFSGSSIWSMPDNQAKHPDDPCEHPALVFRIDENDQPYFGPRVQNPQQAAVYVRNIFDVMRTLFITHSDPSKLLAMDYPEVKILKRIWLDARQHAEKIRNIAADRSAEEVNHEDIQEAIDMLSESQRLRLLGIALLVPPKG